MMKFIKIKRGNSLDFNIACPICSSKLIRSKRKKFNFDNQEANKYQLFRCSNCNGEFSWPMRATMDYEKLGGYTIAEFKNTLQESLRRNFVYTALVTFLDLIKREAILDVGAGLGVSVTHAHNLGFDTYALEVSNALVNTLNRNCPFSKVCLSKGENFNLPKTWPYNYDVISALDVLEHVENPLKVGKHIYNHLSNDGYFIASVPNRERYYYKLGKIIDDFVPKQCGGDNPPYHLTFWREKTIKVFLENLGFKNYYILKGGLLWRKNISIRGNYSRFLSGLMSILYKNFPKFPLIITKFLEHFGTHLIVFAQKGDKDGAKLKNFVKILTRRLYKRDIPFFIECEIK